MTRADLVQRPFSRFLFKEDEAVFYRLRKELLATGSAQACELRMVKRDSTTCWVCLNATAAADKGAPVIRVVLSEIAQRKRVEQALLESSAKCRTLFEAASDAILIAQGDSAAALRDSEEQFRAMATLAPIGIYLCDPQGQCLYVNPAWCAIAEMRPEEALGMRWQDAMHPEDRDLVYASWLRMATCGGRFELEYRFRSGAGKVTRVLGLAAPRRHEKHKPECA